MTVTSILNHYRKQYFIIWIHSAFMAVIALAPFIYLMQVNTRVFNSRSWETLAFLTLIVCFILFVFGVLTYYRSEALRAIGHSIDESLRGEIFDAVHRSGEKDAFRAYGDIAAFRSGVTGPFIANLLDTTLTPLFLGILFLLHPVFGWVAIAFILLLAFLSQYSRKIWQKTRKETKPLEDRAFAFGLASASKAETIQSMNLLPGVRRHWGKLQAEAAAYNTAGASRAAQVDALIKVMRKGQLVLIIGVGAILYLLNEISATTSFAAFIIMMRGVSPVMAVAASWPVIQETKDAKDRLDELLTKYAFEERAQLPNPVGHLKCDHLGYITEGRRRILDGIHFSIPPGSILGVIGPSGAGKSTFLRLLVGGLRPSRGAVKLDGFSVSDQWSKEQLGPSLGYLSQSIDLLPGTIWDNVARFSQRNTDTSAKVIDALRMAGALDIAQQRDKGLDYQLAAEGAPLSGGQRQRLGIARAIYGKPKLVVMDEPTASLDTEGEKQLAFSLVELKAAGSTVVFSTHKASLLEICDYVLVIKDGYMHSFSDKEDILNRFKISGNKILAITKEDGAEPLQDVE